MLEIKLKMKKVDNFLHMNTCDAKQLLEWFTC